MLVISLGVDGGNLRTSAADCRDMQRNRQVGVDERERGRGRGREGERARGREAEAEARTERARSMPLSASGRNRWGELVRVYDYKERKREGVCVCV